MVFSASAGRMSGAKALEIAPDLRGFFCLVLLYKLTGRTTEKHPLDKILDEVADYLRGAERVLFITGAGISADSGLPIVSGDTLVDAAENIVKVVREAA